MKMLNSNVKAEPVSISELLSILDTKIKETKMCIKIMNSMAKTGKLDEEQLESFYDSKGHLKDL